MKVSLNTVKQFTKVDLPVDELVKKINQQLGGVEDVTYLGKRYENAVIAKVVKCEKHPNADKLRVCEVDDGSGQATQVVCGAPNVREGLMVVWLRPGATVPATFDDPEPFVLEPKELRGVVSNGMLASARELGLGDDHSGIVELSEADLLPGKSLKLGASFAETFGLDDTIIDIENKMFTHRPDLFGQLGVAREIAGIQHIEFKSPDWYKNVPEFASADGLEFQVENKASDVVPRFMAVAMKDVQLKPSPLWLQCALVAMGGKPINNIVDVTNYIMLLTAQPTHAYDYDKLRGHYLGTRMATAGEELPLLNGKTYRLDESDIVIVDGEGPVGLAGIMGGGNSEVSADTKSIVLEVANFDMYAVRKSSMRHGVFTDALTRFNKGQSALQNPNIINLLMMSIQDVAGGTQASNVFDSPVGSDDEVHEEGYDVTVDFINQRLGLSLSVDEIIELLANVEVNASKDLYEGEPNRIEFVPPFWRTDLFYEEDFVEEVGRLYGFDKLPRELPLRSTKPAPKNARQSLKQHVREVLSKSGANEVLTYSFVHENTLQKVGQNSKYAFKLSNALSPDLQYYRLSLMSSLLDKVTMNFRAGHDAFALFEIGKTHFKGEMDESEPEVPNEDTHVALVLTNGSKNVSGSAYYQARMYLEQISELEDVTLQPLSEFDVSTDEWGAQLVSAYAPKRSAVIVKHGQIWGVIGEFTEAVKTAFKLPQFTAGFELHIKALYTKSHTYKPLSKFPSIWQDISLKVAQDVSYKALYDVVKTASNEAAAGTEIDLRPVSIYQAENDAEHKTISLRITLTHHDHTLKETDATAVVEAIANAAASRIGASVV